MTFNGSRDNGYTNEHIYEQCLDCKKVKMVDTASEIVFQIGCIEGHVPYLNFASHPDGETLILEENYCKHRVKSKTKLDVVLE
jgi:hypothetical protein